jgi:hypothetical protein
VYGACCCETRASRLGHVTCSIFARGASCALGAGVGAERGASGRVVGAWGVVPRVVGCVVGPGAPVSRCRGWWWVPGCRGRCWGVASRHVLTLYVKSYSLIHILCPIYLCMPWDVELAIGLCTDGAVVGLVVVLEWDAVGVVVVRRAVCVFERRGGCSCVRLVVSYLLLVVVLLCPGVSFSFFLSHPLLLVC